MARLMPPLFLTAAEFGTVFGISQSDYSGTVRLFKYESGSGRRGRDVYKDGCRPFAGRPPLPGYAQQESALPSEVSDGDIERAPFSPGEARRDHHPIRGGDLRDYRAWSKRAASVGEPLSALAGFGEWFPRARDAWVSAAAEAGLWTPSSHGSHNTQTSCRAAEPDRVLGHVADADGTVFHLVVDDAPRSVSLRAAYCRTTVADELLDHTWTDDQRLTCRGPRLRPRRRRRSSARWTTSNGARPGW